jgi:hypothetical protein
VVRIVIDEILGTIAMARDRSPVVRDESQRAVFLTHAAEAALVQPPMLMRAQQRHVVGVRLAAADPMPHVVSIEIALAMAAGERAATIACVERALERCRNRAVLAADIERLAARILTDRH